MNKIIEYILILIAIIGITFMVYEGIKTFRQSNYVECVKMQCSESAAERICNRLLK